MKHDFNEGDVFLNDKNEIVVFTGYYGVVDGTGNDLLYFKIIAQRASDRDVGQYNIFRHDIKETNTKDDGYQLEYLAPNEYPQYYI
jgi:hypothetical protein